MKKEKIFINPKITVITPTYNRADLIVETIESVLSQDYGDFEYLILDDGSNDNTEEVVKPYLKDNRVKYLRHENSGEAETVNWGWSLARGEYFTQVNSDDPILPGLFSEMVRILDARSEVVVAYPDFYFIDKNGKIIKKDKTPDWNFVDALSTFSCYAASAGTFIRKTSFNDWKKIKSSKYKHISDLEMYWKMALRGNFLHVPKFLATWRSHNGAISAQRYKCIPEVHMWFEEYFSCNEIPFYIMDIKEKVRNSINNYCIFLLQQSELADKEKLILEYKQKYLFKYKNLQIGDNDLIGNKFNGHDLHKYLRISGVDSSHLVWNKESDDENTFIIAGDKTNRGDIKQSVLNIQKDYHLDGIVNPIMFDIIYNKLFLEADVVHLHLIHNGLVDVQLLPLLSRLKPVIWTIHDPWPLSGHCIQHFECDKWKSGCKDCPMLDLPFEITKDNSALNYILKKQSIQNANIEIVVASKLMLEKIKEAPAFKNKNVHVVPFGINQEIFYPQNKAEVRKKLNIPKNALVISFRGDNNYKKGLDYIEHVIKNIKTKENVYFLVFGGGKIFKEKRFKYIEYGWVKDDLLMADIYNASDLFLMPSTVESFGMMAIEAMSCGTLPIVLDGTALPEVVNAPVCGVSVKRNKDEYLKMVQYFIDHNNERMQRSEKCLEFAKKQYDKNIYVNRLLKIYREAIARHELSKEDALLLDQLKKYMVVTPVSGNTQIEEKVIYSNRIIDSSSGKLLSSAFRNLKEVIPKNIRTLIRVELLRIISIFFLLKNEFRKILKKVVWYISPTFRMLSGNRHRMDALLEKIGSMYALLEKIGSFEDKNRIILEKIENIERLSMQRIAELRDEAFGEARKDFLPKLWNNNINLLGNSVLVSNDHKSKIINYKLNIVDFFEEIKKFILKTDVVLDIGCGIKPQTFFVPRVHICIEPFKQYRDVIKPLFPNETHFIFLKKDALEAIKTLDDNSVDTVFVIDLIEHLEKENGKLLLEEADRVARKQIIVFTPLGFYPMHYKKGENDAWGLDGIEMQEHKSGWLPEDFGEYWDFHICEDCHEAFLLEEKAVGKKYSALMAIKTKNFKGFPIMNETPQFVKSVYEERINTI